MYEIFGLDGILEDFPLITLGYFAHGEFIRFIPSLRNRSSTQTNQEMKRSHVH